MADLPELPKSIHRQLAIRWSTALHEHGLDGGHLRWHKTERSRIQRIQAQSSRSRSPCPGPSSRAEGAVDHVGIRQSVTVAESRFKDLSEEYFQLWFSSGAGYEIFVDWLESLKRQVSADVMTVWHRGSSAVHAWYERSCAPAVAKALNKLVIERTREARAAELLRIKHVAATKKISIGNPLRKAPIPAVQRDARAAGPKCTMTQQKIEIHGPDNTNLLIERYENGFVWTILNGGLRSIDRIGFELLSAQSFDAKKLAFREAITLRIQWKIKNLAAGKVREKSRMLVRVEGDHLELGETTGMHPLPWPSSDESIDQMWLLTLRVVGLSREWPIKLDLWWTRGTKTLLLAEHSREAAAVADLNLFPNDDPRSATWPVFFDWARKRLGLCLRGGIPDAAWIIHRFDTVADEALGLFVRDERDLTSWIEIVQALSEAALATMGKQGTEVARVILRKRAEQWEEIAKTRTKMAHVPERRWNIDCNDQEARPILRERFERLAAHTAETELNTTFAHRSQAVDAWLDLLQKESPYAKRWKISPLLIASAELCAELKIRALKAGHASKDRILGEVERRFRILASENPRTDLFAIHSGIDEDPLDKDNGAPGVSPPPPIEPEERSRKGDINLLKKGDGGFYVSVDFPTAEKYAGISSRRRQQLMTAEVLKIVGQGQNRRITVESLIGFCPPEEDAK